jgi:sugar O-acyltransferase (sialic acid O-acetyltransferase NeuD family)
MNYDKFDKTKPVVIFGTGMMAQMVRYLLQEDSPFNVVAYSVDKAYLTHNTFDGLPVYAFENLEEIFNPNDIYLLICVGYTQANSFRKKKFNDAKSKGYKFINYISSRASIWPNLVIGENTIIFEHAIIQPYAEIGANCIIRSGAHISHHTQIQNHCFIAAEAVTGGNVKIEQQSFLGVGSVITESITRAPATLVGAGAVVIKSTEENGVYVGNPARRLEKQSDQILQ